MTTGNSDPGRPPGRLESFLQSARKKWDEVSAASASIKSDGDIQTHDGMRTSTDDVAIASPSPAPTSDHDHEPPLKQTVETNVPTTITPETEIAKTLVFDSPPEPRPVEAPRTPTEFFEVESNALSGSNALSEEATRKAHWQSLLNEETLFASFELDPDAQEAITSSVDFVAASDRVPL